METAGTVLAVSLGMQTKGTILSYQTKGTVPFV